MLAAGTRETFANIRERSGRLGPASGGGAQPRSALGFVVDPLGLFRESPLVINDARDEAALEAARKLAINAAELFPRAEGDAPPAPADSQELVRTIGRKLWERRDRLSTLSRRLTLKLLDQTTSRLENRRGAL